MGHSKETLVRLPEAMAECYYYFRILPHYRISGLSLMENAPPRISAEQLKTIRQSVMFIWGTNDPFGSVESGRQIADTLTSSEFNILSGGGHLPWLDDPAECGRLILKFLSETQ